MSSAVTTPANLEKSLPRLENHLTHRLLPFPLPRTAEGFVRQEADLGTPNNDTPNPEGIVGATSGPEVQAVAEEILEDP